MSGPPQDPAGGEPRPEQAAREAGLSGAPAGADGDGDGYVGHTQRYGALLVLILASFAIEGIASPHAWEAVLLSVMLGGSVILAMWAAEVRPVVMHSIAAVVALLIVWSVVEAAAGAYDGAATRIANGILVALAPPAVVLGVLRGFRARQAVTLQAVFGVLCVYILVGMFFAALYGAIEKVGHEAFFAQGLPATVPHALYFSFTTLTTVGYGDFTARTNLGHTMSVSEALIGQVYLVTVVSLFVGNLRPGRRMAA